MRATRRLARDWLLSSSAILIAILWNNSHGPVLRTGFSVRPESSIHRQELDAFAVGDRSCACELRIPEKWPCAGIRQPTRKASFLREGPLASLRGCGHTTGRRFWDGLDTGSIAWTLTS